MKKWRERVAQTWSFAVQEPRGATGYRLGAFHHQESGSRVAFAVGDGAAVYSAIFLIPGDARELAEQVRLRSEDETRHIPKVSNEIAGSPATLGERTALLARLARGKGYIADKCTVSQDYQSPDEPVVLSLGCGRGLEPAAVLPLLPSAAVVLAGRVERAASVVGRETALAGYC